MYCKLGTSIRKCLLWSLNSETSTHSNWQDELHAALNLSKLQVNFIVVVAELCEMEKVLIKKDQIYTRNKHLKNS
jgi:hypothetical protein